jgi:allantoin racemase
MRTRVVTPITAGEFGREAIPDILAVARADNQVDHVQIDRGPASIESEFDEALAIPATLEKIVEAARAGIDAVVINCMGDPGLYPARQLVSIPVVGPFQAAAMTAASLGHRFAVTTVLDAVIPMFHDRAAVYGIRDKMASVRAIDIPVLQLEEDRERMVRALVDVASRQIREDGADVIVFGCTGMAGVADEVRHRLLQQGLDVPVVDPAPLALKWAEALVDMRLSHSGRAFPVPAAKPLPGYPALAPEQRGPRPASALPR